VDTLSPHTVIRPEPGGALLFQQETAETALLDMEGLDALYFLLKGAPRDYHWPLRSSLCRVLLLRPAWVRRRTDRRPL
jgi:hypothetical protein